VLTGRAVGGDSDNEKIGILVGTKIDAESDYQEGYEEIVMSCGKRNLDVLQSRCRGCPQRRKVFLRVKRAKNLCDKRTWGEKMPEESGL